MTELDTKTQRTRRQRIVLATGAICVAAYFAIPGPRGTGLALTVAVIAALCGAFFAVLSRINNRWGRRCFVAVPILAFVTLAVVLQPNFRRAALQRDLIAIGARVKTDADSGNGVWFRWGRVYLPCFLQDQFGEAFFGPIESVDFARETVPPQLAELDFGEPIAILNLSFAKIANEQVARLAKTIDAKQVLLNSVDVDSRTLDEIASMPSLRRVVLIDTQVTKEEAIAFLRSHKGVMVIHGSGNNYGRVRLPN